LADKEDVVCQSISQDILGAVNCKLFELHTFDSLRIKDLFDRLLTRTQDEFKTSAQVQISTARKFLERYPTLEQQEAQIKTTFQKSEPFLRFSKEQMGLGWDDLAEKRQKLVGIQGGSKPTDSAVEAILPMLRKVSALTDKEIKPLSDSHRIYFIHEVGAFPLRLIEGMDKMRTIYRAATQSDKNPLHTHQNDRQFKDLLPSPQEEVQVKQNLVLAVALGLITTVENKANGYSEVRFGYQDKQTGLDKTQTLGADLREAEEYLINDANANLRNILTDALRNIGQSAVTKPDRQAFYQRLMAYLEQFKATLPHGKDDPKYRKVEEAIEEYVKVHNLYIASATPIAPPISQTAPSSNGKVPSEGLGENLEKFKKLVSTCYSKGNPTATELQLLERFRQKYTIPKELAERIIAEVSPKPAQSQDAIAEYALMYEAFLSNDGAIDLEEQAQLIELQEELGLSNEQVTTLETNIQEELAQLQKTTPPTSKGTHDRRF